MRSSGYWLALALLGLSLHARPIAAEEIVLGSSFWPILSDKALEDQGSLTRIIREAYAAVGASMTRLEMPWARILSAVAANPPEIDGGYPFGKTKEREMTYLFSDAIGSATRYVYYNSDRPFQWSSVEDMRGLRIGIVRGAVFGAYHEELNERLKADPAFATIDPAIDELKDFLKLAAGRIDILFCDETQARRAIAQLPPRDQAKIRAATKPIMDRSALYVLFRKDARGELLRELLDAGLKKLATKGAAPAAADAAN